MFLTGLDEHGQKVQEAAKEKGLSPMEHCNKMVPQFTNLWDKLHISNDDFIRTTEKRHRHLSWPQQIKCVGKENQQIH